MKLIDITRRLLPSVHKKARFDSRNYWERRYRDGGNSGAGSYHHLANFKADVLNSFVAENDIKSVIEFGCGDGNQLRLAKYPGYLGLDVSETALHLCRDIFSADQSKCFVAASNYRGERAQLGLSLDVIFHLVEDEVFEHYMRRLFDAAERFVIVYSSNTDDANTSARADHVRHRRFVDWIDVNAPEWKLVQVVPNRYPFDGNHEQTSFADFFIFASDAFDEPSVA